MSVDPHPSDSELVGLPDHPTGTLAVMVVYALLFAIGWALFYVLIFLSRGTLTH